MGFLGFLVFVFLLVTCFGQGTVPSFSLRECNNQNSFDIVENQPTSITCDGLVYWHHIYWSITGPGIENVEKRVGSCVGCNGACRQVCSTSSNGYAVSRTVQTTTLNFTTNLDFHNGAVVKCSNELNTTSAVCRINVIKEYRLENCHNDTLQIVKGQSTTVRCSGLDPSQSMYWRLSNRNGAIFIIAYCGFCFNGYPCPSCNHSNYFNVTRSGYHSDLQVVSNETLMDGWTLGCYKADNATFDQCLIRVEHYNLPQCQQGALEVSETQSVTIICTGLQPSDNVLWMVFDGSEPPLNAAFCENPNNFGLGCTVNDTNLFFATRTATVSNFTILKSIRKTLDKKTIICARSDSTDWDSCRVQVVYGPTQAFIESHSDYTNDGENVTFTCTSDDAYPSTQFNWSVPCVTLNSSSKVSTCSVAIATLDDVTEVTCVAYNSLFTNLNASDVYRIPSATVKQSQDIPVASVAGGIVAGVFVLVIGVIVVVCFVGRNRSAKPTPTNQTEEFEEYINDTYDSTGDIEPPDNIPSPTTPTTSLENARNNQQKPEESRSPEDIPYVNTASVEAASSSSDVYAKVMKNGKDKILDTSSKDVQSKPNETYAQVQKKLKGENASNQAELSALNQRDNGQGETAEKQNGNCTEKAESVKTPTEYANCPKETSSGSVYVNVGQSSGFFANEDVKKGQETADEYNRLRCTKTGAQEGTSPYNHLGDC